MSTGNSVISIPIDRIRPFDAQPRKRFDRQKLENLARSLKRGQRVPITVRTVTGDPDHGYELIDGERRFRAAKIAELPYLLAWVRHVTNARRQYIESVVSNFGREEHTALEKAAALAKMQEEGMSVSDIADEVGMSEPWVYNHLGLTRLVPQVAAMLDPDLPDGQRLSPTAGMRLGTMPQELQLDLAKRMIAAGAVSGTDATFFITQAAHKHGIRQQGRSPRNDSKSLQLAVRRIAKSSLNANALSSDVLARMLGECDRSRPRDILKDLDSTIASLSSLRAKVSAAQTRKTAAA